MNRTAFACTALVCLTGAGTALLVAGPLNPPAGAVAPTYKTLTDIDPRIVINSTNTPGDSDATPSTFKIASPGSYVLTGNLLLAANKIGIEITSSNVTIDLGGHQLTNISSLPAIAVTADGLRNINLRNGGVSGTAGIDLLGGTLNIPAETGRIEDIVVNGTAGDGLVTQAAAVVVRCAARNCGRGIRVSSGSTMSQCTATGCGIGISMASGSTATDCAAFNNTGSGFNTGFGATLQNCSAYSNEGTGINASALNTIRGCNASFNTGDGIAVSIGSVVAQCSLNSNTNDGIQCDYGCLIVENVCRQNGNSSNDGAGIHVLNNDNRIEGNNCSNADRGIDIDGSGNIIVRNTCATNTIDYTIAANNVFGTIVDRRSPASGAVSGSAASSTLGTTDANANFSY